MYRLFFAILIALSTTMTVEAQRRDNRLGPAPHVRKDKSRRDVKVHRYDRNQRYNRRGYNYRYDYRRRYDYNRYNPYPYYSPYRNVNGFYYNGIFIPIR